MATYYFLNTDLDEDWSNSNNWWDAPSGGNSGYTPTSSDDVVIMGYLSTISSGTADVTNMTIEANFQITATVSGTCTVQNYGYLGDGGIIYGNVVCTTDGIIGLNNAGATINGNLTFYNNGSTENMGAVYVTGNLYLEANWTGSIESITVSFDAIYAYGYTGTTNNLTTTGNILYSNYPNLYFNNASTDYDWNTLNNWWVDSGFTQKAAALPTSSQNVYINANIYFNSGGTAEANNLYVQGASYYLDTSVTVSGTATFSNGSTYGSISASPAITLSVSSFVIEDSGYVGGNATITISGDKAYFYDTSYNNGTISGNASFNDSSTNGPVPPTSLEVATISGDADFHNTSINYGTATNANFYDSSSNASTGNITGTGTAVYPVNRNSFNSGTISSVSYSGYPANFYLYGGTWYIDSGHTTSAAYTPSGLDDVIIEDSNVDLTNQTFFSATFIGSASFYTNSGSLTVNNTITFNDSSTAGGTYTPAVVVTSSAVFNNSAAITSGSSLTADYPEFNDSSVNNGGITNAVSPVIFRDSSSNASGATVSGDAQFYDSSTNAGTISGNATVYSPHAAPFDSGGGNTGTVSGTISYSGYSPRTVYFNGAADGDWNNIANWWDDDTFTTQSLYVPNGVVSLDNTIISATINSNSYASEPVVDAFTMNSGTLWILITVGSAQLNNNSEVRSVITCNNPSGTITFSDLSSNTTSGSVSTLTGEVIFQDSSTNDGNVTTGNGNILVYYPVVIPLGGTLSPGFGASVVYLNYPSYFNDSSGGSPSNDGDWNNSNNWYLDSANLVSAGSVPTETYPGVNVILQKPVTNSSGGSPTAYNLLCDDYYTTGPITNIYIDNISIIVYGLATFGDKSISDEQEAYEEVFGGSIYFGGGELRSAATITGDAFFRNGARNRGGTISGLTTFTLSSAKAMIVENAHSIDIGTYTGGVQFKYGKGVNGSSILGIV